MIVVTVADTVTKLMVVEEEEELTPHSEVDAEMLVDLAVDSVVDRAQQPLAMLSREESVTAVTAADTVMVSPLALNVIIFFV